MKKLILIIMAVSILMSGCANQKIIEHTEYGTYGLFNYNEMKNDNIKYRLVWGNIVWSIILCETIIAPIYFLGFSVYEPVRKITNNESKGSVN